MVGIQLVMTMAFSMLSPIMPLFLPVLGVESDSAVAIWAGVLNGVTSLVAAWLATRIAHDLRSQSPAGVEHDRLAQVPRDLWRGTRRLLATPPAIGGVVSAAFDQVLFGIVSVLRRFASS